MWRVLRAGAAVAAFGVVGSAPVSAAPATPTPAPSAAAQPAPAPSETPADKGPLDIARDIAGGGVDLTKAAAGKAVDAAKGAAGAAKGAAEAVAGAAKGVGDKASAVGGTAKDIATGDICLMPPQMEWPDSGPAGWIDKGPTSPGAGKYSQWGWGGWGPVLFDPGCPVGLDPLKAVNGAQKRVADPSNSAAAGIVNLTLIAAALDSQATEVVVNPEGAWQAITPLTSFMRYTLGNHIWVMLLAAGLCATALYHAAAAHRGDVAASAKTTVVGGLVLAFGAACLMSVVTVGPVVSAASAEFFGALQQGTSQSVGQVDASPDAAVSDSTADAVLYATWVQMHFGSDEAAAAEFGPRLRAAASATRGEQAQAVKDPAYARDLTARKRADFIAVAKEYRAKYPATYQANLAGVNTMARPWKALIGLLGKLPTSVFLIWTLWWIAMARLVLELVVAAGPAGAVFAQHPKLQFVARAVVRFVVVYAVMALVAIVVYTVYVGGVIGGIVQATDLSIPAKYGWMLVILVLSWQVWKHGRSWLAASVGLDSDSHKGLGVARAMLTELRALVRQERDNDEPADKGNAPTVVLHDEDGTVVATVGDEPGMDVENETPPRIPDPMGGDAETYPDAADPTSSTRDSEDPTPERGDDTDGTEPEPERPRDSDEPARLPDPVDNTAPIYEPVVNETPPETKFTIMEDAELSRRADTKKESDRNVFEPSA